MIPFEERFGHNSSHNFSGVDAIPTEVGIWIGTRRRCNQDSIYISTCSTQNSLYVIYIPSSSTTSLYGLLEPCQRQEKDHKNT